MKKKVIVMGSGPMGLTCAYDLAKKGFQVNLIESHHTIGGMSACFKWHDIYTHYFYHFIMKGDKDYIELLHELGLGHKLIWKETKMGFYYKNKIHSWSSPQDLLRFPHLSFINKCRYAAHVLHCKNIRNWQKYDNLNAIHWLRRWLGNDAYQILWDYLFNLKFHHHQDDISAAWIANRIQKLGQSREGLSKEVLGYLDGSSLTLLEGLKQGIRRYQGQMTLSDPVKEITFTKEKQPVVRTASELYQSDAVVSTIPLSHLNGIDVDLPKALKHNIATRQSLAVVCVLFLLKKPLSPFFWLNINDPKIKLPGIIEYSNLADLNHHLVYAPYYFPQQHAQLEEDDAHYQKEVRHYLQTLFPHFKDNQIIDSRVLRYQHAQTICTQHFFDNIPDYQVENLPFFIADTSSYYPVDRCISESIKVGKQLAVSVEKHCR